MKQGEEYEVRVASGKEKVLKLLIPLSNVEETNNKGALPITEAAKVGDAETTRMLLAAGANPNARRDERYPTALMIAAARASEETLVALLEGGADPGIRMRSGGEVVDALATARTANRKKNEEVLTAWMEREIMEKEADGKEKKVRGRI